MKRRVVMGAALVAAAMGLAQVAAAVHTAAVQPVQAPPHDRAAERRQFGAACGIQDTSPSSALRFVRSDSGEWNAVGPGQEHDTASTGAARVWHEGNWMVDIHDSPAAFGGSVHAGRMCFDAEGRVRQMLDHYMKAAPCWCMRFTSLSFTRNGRVTRWSQAFVNARTGKRIDRPEEADEFPEVYQFRRMEQLPFYPLLSSEMGN